MQHKTEANISTNTHIFLTERGNFCKRKGLQLILLLLMLAFFAHPTFAKELVWVDGMSNGFPAETCYEMMQVLVNEFALSEEGAASVLGNVAQESMFNAHTPGYYYGICQWDPNYRWPQISSWIINNGYSTDSPVAQLRAIFGNGDDSNRAEGDAYATILNHMKEVTSLDDGVSRFLYEYEGCGANLSERLTYAKTILAFWDANK